MHRTALYDRHRALGGRMVEFGGWEMPVQYGGASGGIVNEHRATRSAAGLFDLGHMGRLFLDGPGAVRTLDHVLSFDVPSMEPGQARYGFLLDERGTTLDDVILYRLPLAGYANEPPEQARWLLVVNASNRVKDLAWIADRMEQGTRLEDGTFTWGMIAVQGPKAADIVGPIVGMDLSDLGYYQCRVQTSQVRMDELLDPLARVIARTGYTGEDGFELYVRRPEAGAIWDRLLHEGAPQGLVPVGLGARDTLRLEAAMPLYGHELDETTTPLEAGLGFALSLDRADFVGRQALLEQKERGPGRRLAGFAAVEGKKIPRQGYAVYQGDRQVGAVTSGTWSPTLERTIGMAYVETGLHVKGTRLEVDVRGTRVPVEIVKRPFYKRES